jgi:regulator of ribosome biosynthesis
MRDYWQSSTQTSWTKKHIGPLKLRTGISSTLITPYDTFTVLYRADTEAYLQATARDGAQALINGLFDLPIRKSGDGPLAMLPPIETPLPRAKPLPKPKAPTKWEQFAAAKGIQKTRREKKVWDEEKQEWGQRWGRGAKNKQVEEQWAVEVPSNARTSQVFSNFKIWVVLKSHLSTI